jgi:hypothetical protein
VRSDPPTPAPGRVVAKSLDRDRLTVRSVLTYPVEDQDGDFVRPDGGDWDSKFRAHPLVNWWHELPVGRGYVEMKSVEHDGQLWDVPIGTTQFFRTAADCRGLTLAVRDPDTYAVAGTLTPAEAVEAARDAFRLVADEVATGVSIEFKPDPAFTTDTGRKSLMRGRPSRRYERWTGLGWAHTPRPVNPSAQTILPESVEKAHRIVRDKAFADGKPICAVVLKSLSRLTPRTPTTITVPRTVRKAMEDEILPPAEGEPTADQPADEPADTPASDTPPEAAVSYDGAQMLADFAQQLRDVASKTLDDKTHKSLMKCAERLEAEAEDLTAVGEAVEDKLAGRNGDKTESPAEDTPADDAPAESDESASDPEPYSEDEAKSLPRKLERKPGGAIVLKSQTNYTPRRLKLSDLGDPKRKAAPTGDDPRLIARLERRLRELERAAR